MARHIAETGNRPRLWLTGRSLMTGEVTERLAEVEALGARIRYRQVDVTDPAGGHGAP
ncbi:KR domain-containing protein [Roseibium salinum]|nr:KR domain-containing protein [Roseibium salinum]